MISTDRGRTIDFHNHLPTEEALWNLLDSVPDPEVPAVSVVDLGIVRSIEYTQSEAGQDDTGQEAPGYWQISITPTYSGCPATELIENEIRGALQRSGVKNYAIQQQLSPSWTTDWITDKGREQLRKFGIAPPAGDSRKPGIAADIECPRCGSNHHKKISEFGSTACKALYQCEDCQEPFDYFKCI
ncbi:phenylacetate-CoA oxygenase subunit PaaJ [Motiliproteus sp. MSK22-1]|nr:phenylacetate-CoA oxygenase subunit PaaJ [Motiliproteus sp. MSK22-1]